MKIHKVSLSAAFIITAAVLLLSTVTAGYAFEVEADIPKSEVVVPVTLTVNIYASKTAATPVATQDFSFGQWSADYEFWNFRTITQDMVRIKANFTETASLTRDMQLWVRMEFDGVPKGERQMITGEAWAMFSEEAGNAIDVEGRDINPRSISIPGAGEVINSSGQWVGDKSGLERGDDGVNCWDTNQNERCDIYFEDMNYDFVCNALDCQGPKGPIGRKGDRGPQGIQGKLGPQGDQGKIGPEGPPGAGFQDGSAPGDMLYWDGAAWVLIPAPVVDPLTRALTLTLCEGVPQWTSPYEIGDRGPAGGIVFYITDCGLHGLEAAPADQSDAEWGCVGTAIPGADGTAVGTGAQNTADIIAGCATAGIAARVADAYELNGYEDWFLPSKDELDLMYDNLHLSGLGGFADGFYWSSSESSSFGAWFQDFGSGLQSGVNKDGTIRVRGVRAF